MPPAGVRRIERSSPLGVRHDAPEAAFVAIVRWQLSSLAMVEKTVLMAEGVFAHRQVRLVSVPRLSHVSRRPDGGVPADSTTRAGHRTARKDFRVGRRSICLSCEIWLSGSPHGGGTAFDESPPSRGYRKVSVESSRRKRMKFVRPRGKAYWRSFRKKVKGTDFMEDVLRNMVRYKRDKLIREQAERGIAESPTIIPFPSEKAQAADGSADPSDGP